MEPLFEVRVRLDESHYRELYMVGSREMRHENLRNFLLYTGIYTVCFIVSILAGESIGPPLCLLLLGLLVYSRGSLKARENKIIHQYVLSDKLFTEERVYRFFKDSLTESAEGRGEWRIQYGECYQLVETDKILLLFTSKLRAYILPKDSFTAGQAVRLTAYFKNECRLPYQYVKVK